ncbi:MAG: hypothetical protein RLZZ543_715 [Bacteroidota bacterium]|jgi:fructokinase
MKKVVCFGEVLWDKLPTGAVAGGAPMNVAIRLASLGMEATMISAIGNDTDGTHLLDILKERNVKTDLIQLNAFPTGEVLVDLNEHGHASYTIVAPAAWDAIEYNEQQQEAVLQADAFVLGSLGCRDKRTFNSLKKLLPYSHFPVLDVNLRAPFFSSELIAELAPHARLLKMNEEELDFLSKALKIDGESAADLMQAWANRFDIDAVCVTKGSNGAQLFINNQLYEHAGFTAKVKDTIGAGDSFLAGLLYSMLTNETPQHSLAFASALGALVAEQEGANPEIPKSLIEHKMASN